MIRSSAKLLTSLAGGQPVLPQLQSALLGAAAVNHWACTAKAPTSTFSDPGTICVADGADCSTQNVAVSGGPLSYQEHQQLSSGRHPWPGFQINALRLQQLSPRSKAVDGASLHTAASGVDGVWSNARQRDSSHGAEQSKAITRLIRDAEELGQLQDLVSQHSSHFNAINVAAAFSRILSLAPQQQQQSEAADAAALAAEAGDAAAAAAPDNMPLLLGRLAALWLQQLRHARPRELANVLLACSKLSVLDIELWSSTLASLLQHVDSMNAQDASSAVYALALAAYGDGLTGMDHHKLSLAATALSQRVSQLAADAAPSAAEGASSSPANSSGSGPAAALGGKSSRHVAAQAISNTLWGLARLKVQPPLPLLSGLLQGLAKPKVLNRAEPLALVNTLWALSELQELPGWFWNTNTLGSATLLGSTSGSKGVSRHQRQQQQTLAIIPPALLSEQQLQQVAESSPQAVSNAVLAISRFASGPVPHLLEVPAAQGHIRQLLQGPTAAAVGKWNAQDVGNAVYAAAQVGVTEAAFLQGVIAAAPQWLPGAGALPVMQVALGFARLKHRHCSDFLDALVLRGKHLLLQYHPPHHHHHHHHATSSSTPSSSTSSSGLGSTGLSQQPDDADQQEQLVDQQQQQLRQQQQQVCERLATDLSWTIAVLGQVQLAREVEQLIRASGIKQESSLHPKNARRLWTVHAWLERHKLAGGHGLRWLLTEQQLAYCAAASRHTHRVTPSVSAPKGLGGL